MAKGQWKRCESVKQEHLDAQGRAEGYIYIFFYVYIYIYIHSVRWHKSVDNSQWS